MMDVIIARFRSGDDPLDVIGGTTPTDIAYAAQAWLNERIPAPEVEHWLTAGCWRADRVRQLLDAGVPRDVFFEADGRPLMAGGQPLVDAVMTGTVTVAQVQAWARRLR